MRSRRQASPLSSEDSGLDDPGRVAELFGLVADKTRAGVLYALSDSDELTFDQLVVALNAPEGSVLGALRTLRSAQMVRSRRRHDDVWYSLRDHDIKHLLHVAAASASEILASGPHRDAGRRSASRLSVRR